MLLLLVPSPNSKIWPNSSSVITKLKTWTPCSAWNHLRTWVKWTSNRIQLLKSKTIVKKSTKRTYKLIIVSPTWNISIWRIRMVTKLPWTMVKNSKTTRMTMTKTTMKVMTTMNNLMTTKISKRKKSPRSPREEERRSEIKNFDTLWVQF